MQAATANGAPSSPPGASSKKRKRDKSDGTAKQPAKSNVRRQSAVKLENGHASSSSAANGWTDEMEHSLVPTPLECEQLASVIKMLDKHGMANEQLPDEAGVSSLLEALSPTSEGFPHSLSTLEFYLDLAVSGVRNRLQARIGKGKQPASAVTDDLEASFAALASLEATIKRLLEECKDAAARRMGKIRFRPSPTRYALHRTIGVAPHTIDLFTSASDLSLSELPPAGLKDTDVLAIAPSSVHSIHVPTIRDVNGVPLPPEKTPTSFEPELEPVTFLYYGPYDSFAPTYDSSTATISYTQTAHWRTSRQALHNWQKRPLPALPPLAPASSTSRPSLDTSLQEIDPALIGLQASQPSQDDVKAMLRMLEDSQVVDDRLKENVEYLRILQEAQFAKLRSSNSDRDEQNQQLPSEIEAEAARRLQESLTAILNARPRIPNLPAQNPLIPPSSPDHWAKLKKDLIQARTPSYQGTLDASNSKSVRERFMGGRSDGAADTKPGTGRKSSSPKKERKASLA